MLKKTRVANGVYWVEAPEAGLFILCGCPADSVKHLMRKGLIATTEQGGTTTETGPNAILLSDLPLQGGRFCNLGEFPVLQMLYRQGMMVPGHPNCTGAKPLIVGSDEQVKAQVAYIHRGNYGLLSTEELVAAGVTPAMADLMMRVKLRFAFSRIRDAAELVDTRVVGPTPVELRGGVTIQRLRPNVFAFAHAGQSLTVDLNLARGEEYEAPYELGFHTVRREYFSVIHSGEGDGWDPRRPCMASVLTHQGRIYLLDTGPNLFHSLTSLGIGVSEVAGVFQTHAHDDHVNGLTILLRADHRLRYYATPFVRKSVHLKMAALTGMTEADFARYFDLHDLTLGEWNNVDGLEVRPVYSPHPVDTTVLFFRTLWGDGYKTYAHLADIPTFDALHRLATEPPATRSVPVEFCESIRREYLEPVDLKKLDSGGGLIHGDVRDFRDDHSGKILVSHLARPLTDVEKGIGSDAAFGMVDVLIPADQDFGKSTASQSLQAFFPGVPMAELRMLLNCPCVLFNPGSILIRQGDRPTRMYFVLEGIMEFIVPDRGIRNRLTAGSLAGETSALTGVPARGTFRAASYVRALEIPCRLYTGFLKRNGVFDAALRDLKLRRFLDDTWLFGEMISCPVKNRLAQSIRRIRVPAGECVEFTPKTEFFLIEEGQVALGLGTQPLAQLGPGDLVGAEACVLRAPPALQGRATTPVSGFLVPFGSIADIPIVQWKLREAAEAQRRVLSRTTSHADEAGTA